jgi:transposase-like protein
METLCRGNHLANSKMVLKYALSYRNLEEIMAERGIKVDLLLLKEIPNKNRYLKY